MPGAMVADGHHQNAGETVQQESEQYMSQDTWYEEVEESLSQQERNALGMKIATMVREKGQLVIEKANQTRGINDRIKTLDAAISEHSRGMTEGKMKRDRPMARIHDIHRQQVIHLVTDSHPPIVTLVRDMDEVEAAQNMGSGEVDESVVRAASEWVAKNRAVAKAVAKANRDQAEIVSNKRRPGRPKKVAAPAPIAAKPKAPAKAKSKFDLSEVKGVSPRIKSELARLGIRTAEDVIAADPDKLAAVKGLGAARAANLLSYAKEHAPNYVPAPKRPEDEETPLEVGSAEIGDGIPLDEIFGDSPDEDPFAANDGEGEEESPELDTEDSQEGPDED